MDDQALEDFIEDVRNYIEGHPVFMTLDSDDAYSWLLSLTAEISGLTQALLDST